MNKPAGMPMRPFPDKPNESLKEFLVRKGGISPADFDKISFVNYVHGDASGLIMIIKNTKAKNKIEPVRKCFRRTFCVIVHGELSGENTINKPIPSGPTGELEDAISNYKVIETFPGHSLLQVELKTNRKDQILRHFSVVSTEERRMIHLRKISTKHPGTNKDVEFEVDLPEHMKQFIAEAKGEKPNITKT